MEKNVSRRNHKISNERIVLVLELSRSDYRMLGKITTFEKKILEVKQRIET